jgi:hypothetical protein
MKSRTVELCAFVILAALAFAGCSGGGPGAAPAALHRTVIGSEVGSIFQNPGGTFPYSEYGAFVGSPEGDLPDEAINCVYGEAFELAPGKTYGEPIEKFYAALKEYDASQTAAGQPAIFITATYQGKSLPVYYAPSLGLSPAGVPTAPRGDWQQAVNVSDSRFVNFWIANYASNLVKGGSKWLELDEGEFSYGVYGVLNEAGVFVPNVTWNEPYPQDDTAYLQGIASFYNQLATYNETAASPINTLTDLGSISQPSLYPVVFNGAPGILVENILSWYTNPTESVRNSFYEQCFQLLPWMGSQNKIAILRAEFSGGRDDLISAFSMYSLLKGFNFFFAPGNLEAVNTDPNLWSNYLSTLGNPNGPMTSSGPSAQGPAYRLYQRPYSGGVVYLNWTGSTQTVNLGSEVAYYDPDGNAVTSLSIPDGVGTFVTFAPSSESSGD